jgi:hypothetical protein
VSDLERALVPVGIVLFWLLIVGPIKWLLGRTWPESRLKRFLFKQR